MAEKKTAIYDESKIQTLSSLEHIRKRSGMYIGRLGNGSNPDDGIYVLLKEVIDNEYSDYYKPFTCIKAVYMIIDGNTGKQYVGSAYDNNESLWARWRSYATTYHGNNQQLKELYKQYGNDYFLKFKYIILRVFPISISNKEIIDAESWYKERFMTREFGLNSN